MNKSVEQLVRTMHPLIGQFNADDAFGMDIDGLYSTIETRHAMARDALFIVRKRTSHWPEIDLLRITLCMLEGWVTRVIGDELYIHQNDPEAVYYNQEINDAYKDLQKPVQDAIEKNRKQARVNMYLHPERGSQIARWRDVICKRLKLSNPLDLFPDHTVPPTEELKERRSQHTLESILFVCYQILQGTMRSEVAEARGWAHSIITQITTRTISETAGQRLKAYERELGLSPLASRKKRKGSNV